MKDESLQNRIDELLDLNNQLFIDSERMKEALKTCLDEFKNRFAGVSPTVMRSNSEMIRLCATALKAEGRQG